MSLFRIALRSIQQRGVASALTMFSMALGVALVVGVLLIHGEVSKSFHKNSALGYNMIVGPKGGKLQLTLNTVYYLSEPIETLPYSYYLEFKPAADRTDGQNGRYAQFITHAVPVCLGDYYGRFRVVGTTPDLFNKLSVMPAPTPRPGEEPAEPEKLVHFAQGRNLETHSKENGYFDCVVGATVAREMNIKLGDKVNPSHGAQDGHTHEQPFTVVGILEREGSPYDRGVFVNIEGFYLMDGHAKPVEEEETEAPAADATAEAAPAEEAEHDHDHAAHGDFQPLPLDQREITAVLVRTGSPFYTAQLQNVINEGVRGQAVLPIQEIFSLFDTFIAPIQKLLLGLTAMICLVSGISILVSIYNSMSDRRREIAIMRALGAGRSTVMSIILVESILLVTGGGLLGWVGSHALVGLFSGVIAARTGVTIGFFDVAPPVDLIQLLTAGQGSGSMTMPVSTELLLIPCFLLLAVLVGMWPAITAYRTDVAKSL